MGGIKTGSLWENLKGTHTLSGEASLLKLSTLKVKNLLLFLKQFSVSESKLDVQTVIFKKNCYISWEGKPVKIVFVPFSKGVYSIRKEFAPTGSKFFPYRIDPFSEGDSCTGKQTGNHKCCLPCKNCPLKLPPYFITVLFWFQFYIVPHERGSR